MATGEEGQRIHCHYCPAVAVLPFTDATKTAVLIEPLEGWTSPPPTCPACRAKEAGPLCPHGADPAECNDCAVLSDLAYDSAREDRLFGR